MSKNKANLDVLVKKRTSIIGRITSFKSYLAGLNLKIEKLDLLPEEAFIELEQRINRFEPIYEEFCVIQGEVESIVEEANEQYEERERFEQVFFSALASGKHILNKNNAKEDVANSEKSVVQEITFPINNAVKLPTISLPKFEGEYETWLEYRDTFESLINSNTTISNMQKFHYLRASLVNGAAQVIQALEFSEANYSVAWDLICARFNNSRILKRNHVKSLFDLEPLQKESATKIRKLIDDLTKHLRSLEILGEPVCEWDTLIIYIVTTKLDRITLREWEEFKNTNDVITLENLKQFLRGRADFLETLDPGNRTEKQYNNNNNARRDIRHNVKSFLIAAQTCVICEGEHSIRNCEKFLKLSLNERSDRVKTLKLCYNCLRTGHYVDKCNSVRCKKCKLKHHTLLHFNKSYHDNTPNTSVALTSYNITEFRTLLSTAIVQVRNGNISYRVKALLDSGSEGSFITTELCNKLELCTKQIDISGLNEMTSNIKTRCEAKIVSQQGSFEIIIPFLVVPKIANNIPAHKMNASKLEIPNNIRLADPDFCKPSTIDILIGADQFWSLICIGQIKLGDKKPVLQKTKLGWIISGPLREHSVTSNVNCNFARCDSNTEIQMQLSKFWELEEIQSKEVYSMEEKACELHFQNNVSRDSSGRFIVSIPFKDSPERLGDSRNLAEKRFLNLERKFRFNPHLQEMYVAFLKEYEMLGHSTKLGRDNHLDSYYMPHHGVIKEENTTTKLRVVFDASASTTTGVSLNDIQMVGPCIQQDLISILLRFRKYSVVFTSDIEKMYRQVLVQPDERRYQQILWRERVTDPIEAYQLNTVTYGTASAAYLAIRCLHELAFECESTNSNISKVIKRDFYVDDLLSGADDVPGAISICTTISEVLESGGFKLRKWRSNESRVLTSLNSTPDTFEFGVKDGMKILGLMWSHVSDVLIYKINVSKSDKVTKRTVLSAIAKIFDPLGLLSASTVIGKILLQKVWLEKLSWDESLPSELHYMWCNFRDNISALNELKITRKVVCSNHKEIELHAFSDASQCAYAAAIYVRSVDNYGNVFAHLLTSKTKVSPLKPTTIPRLELSGALILARLLSKVVNSMELSITRCICWSDSTIVLAWINTNPGQLKQFVANRVAEIQDLTAAYRWQYVPTSDNPADLATRGLDPTDLADARLWWHGPEWLCLSEEYWPNPRLNSESIPELKINTINVSMLEEDEGKFPYRRFSTLNKLKRVTSFCLRFTKNSLHEGVKLVGALSHAEIQRAYYCLLRLSQRESFPNEYRLLTEGKLIDYKSKILKLNPFLDSNSIIRVGGRLSQSAFEYDKRYPIIISAKHYITKLIFVSEHLRLLHAGPQLLLSSLRECLWPIAGRNLAKQTCRRCIRCFRTKPKLTSPRMGDLPALRVSPSHPFAISGVDYAGPFLIKDRQGRGCKMPKHYVCLFVCFAVKAIHLELVSSLSTDSFVMALRRFVSRRGKPSKIFSDNGTNFIGARNDLNHLGVFLTSNQNRLTESFAQEAISWSFIPPNSPHFGGLWEAGVKSSKYHIKRVLGNACLTYEQFYTLLTQIEGILNSRPLFPLSSEPDDLLPITPAHFLIGRTLTSIPEADITHLNEGRLSIYQRIQQLNQNFWKRWHKEYISELQVRVKWNKHNSNLKVGDLVLVKDTNQMPLCWPLGRIVDVHMGQDGIVRVATIKTANGVVKRSFARLCPLPINDMEGSSVKGGVLCSVRNGSCDQESNNV